jgi:hypothetical protein
LLQVACVFRTTNVLNKKCMSTFEVSVVNKHCMQRISITEVQVLAPMSVDTKEK